ncbi:MAG: hypothetical protein ABJR05_14870 [Balneola sp.]
MVKALNLVLLIIFFVSNPLEAQYTELIEERRVTIPEHIFLGEIRHLDIQGDRILITDISLAQVVLFEGEKWKILNPEECHPGFFFAPIQAKFGDSEDIFITNSGTWGFRFDKNGKCIGAVEEKSVQPEKFFFSDRIVGVRSTLSKKEIVSWNRNGGNETIEFFITPEFPSAEYRIEGGGVIKINASIYLVTTLTPLIYKYEFEKDKLSKSKMGFKHFSTLRNDITNDINSSQFFKEIGKIFSTSSIIQNLFIFNTKSGIVVFRNNEASVTKYYGMIFDLNDLSEIETITFQKEPMFIRTGLWFS